MDIVIPGKIPSKKNSKRMVMNRATGRMFPISSKAFMAWHEEVMLIMSSEKNKLSAAHRNHIPIRVPCVVKVAFYAHDARLFDLTNKAESVMDLLVDAGFLSDDNISVVRNLEIAFMGIDRKNPRAEVKISY